MAGEANIVSSAYTASTQKDGRNTVVELHTDLVGVVHQQVYLASASDDLNANLAGHASALAASLESGEVAANVAQAQQSGHLAALTFVYSTAAENYLAIRAAYQSATGQAAINLGDFLHGLTALQIMAAFNFATAVQASSFITSTLAPQATLAANVRSAAGV